MKTKSNTLEDKKDRFTPGEWKAVSFPDVVSPYYIESNERIKEIYSINEMITEDGKGIYYGEAKANAEHIVKCVNAFPELVEMLDHAIAYCEEYESKYPDSVYPPMLQRMKDALTKVK